MLLVVDVPLTALLLAVGPQLVPELPNPAAGRVDAASAAPWSMACLPIVFEPGGVVKSRPADVRMLTRGAKAPA